MAACPRLIPPSLGGLRVQQDGETLSRKAEAPLSVSRAFWEISPKKRDYLKTVLQSPGGVSVPS